MFFEGLQRESECQQCLAFNRRIGHRRRQFACVRGDPQAFERLPGRDQGQGLEAEQYRPLGTGAALQRRVDGRYCLAKTTGLDLAANPIRSRWR